MFPDGCPKKCFCCSLELCWFGEHPTDLYSEQWDKVKAFVLPAVQCIHCFVEQKQNCSSLRRIIPKSYTSSLLFRRERFNHIGTGIKCILVVPVAYCAWYIEVRGESSPAAPFDALLRSLNTLSLSLSLSPSFSLSLSPLWWCVVCTGTRPLSPLPFRKARVSDLPPHDNGLRTGSRRKARSWEIVVTRIFEMANGRDAYIQSRMLGKTE